MHNYLQQALVHHNKLESIAKDLEKAARSVEMMLSTTELTKVMWLRSILLPEISVLLRTLHVIYKWHSALIILFDRLWV